MGNLCCGPSDSSHVSDINQHKPIRFELGVEALKMQYDIKEILGQGAFGKVYRASNIKDPNIQVAIKTINKQHLEKNEIDDILNEINVLESLDHPGVVKYYETYDDTKYIYLVMELLRGKDLDKQFKEIRNQGKRFREPQLAKWFYDLFEIIMHYQSQKIIHRDIKLENIMFDDSNQLKLVDFGLALQTKRKVTEAAGTGYYMSPGVINHDHGQECDLWSVGVCLYYLVEGKYPFNGRSLSELFSNIRRGEYVKPQNCSKECSDFISKLLVVEATDRMTAKDAIKHSWIKNNLGEKRLESLERSGEIQQAVYERIKSYANKSLLDKSIMCMFVQFFKPEQVEKQRAWFEQIDTDHSGFIDFKEFNDAILNTGLEVSEKEILDVMNKFSYGQSQNIHFTEFVAATIDIDTRQIPDERRDAIYQMFNVDGKEGVDRDDIKKAFNKISRNITEEEIDEIFKEFNKDNDTHIDREEWRQAVDKMMGQPEPLQTEDYEYNQDQEETSGKQ